MSEQLAPEQDIEALKQAYRDACVQRSTAEHDRRQKESKLKEDANDRIQRELDADFAERIRLLTEIEHETKSQLDAARSAKALTGEGAPYPLGTKLLEWDKPNRWSGELTLTGRSGVVEAVTGESQHPSNIGSYSRAKTGSFVIRFLKKNGKRGLQYEKADTWTAQNRWFPEGVSPGGER